jgi:hypothetical protein
MRQPKPALSATSRLRRFTPAPVCPPPDHGRIGQEPRDYGERDRGEPCVLFTKSPQGPIQTIMAATPMPTAVPAAISQRV